MAQKRKAATKAAEADKEHEARAKENHFDFESNRVVAGAAPKAKAEKDGE